MPGVPRNREGVEIPPPVNLREETAFSVPGPPTIWGLERVPSDANDAVLLCHPHPQMGGTMHNAVVAAIARELVGRAGVAHARFDFRGVGDSEGAYDAARGEVDDASRVLDHLAARAPGARLSIVGYSFGSVVAHRLSQRATLASAVLLCPVPTLFPYEGALRAERRLVCIGDRDDFTGPAEAEALARELDASLHVFPGEDHFFLRTRRQVAAVVGAFLAPCGGTEVPP